MEHSALHLFCLGLERAAAWNGAQCSAFILSRSGESSGLEWSTVLCIYIALRATLDILRASSLMMFEVLIVDGNSEHVAHVWRKTDIRNFSKLTTVSTKTMRQESDKKQRQILV